VNYLDLFVFLNVKELEQNKIFTLRAGFLGIPLPRLYLRVRCRGKGGNLLRNPALVLIR